MNIFFMSRSQNEIITRVHECTIYSSRSWKLECIIIIIRRLEDIRRLEIIKVQYLEMLYTEFEVSSSNTMAVREILWCSPKIPYNNRHEHFNSMLSRNANRSFQMSSLDSTEIYCVGNMLLQTMHAWHILAAAIKQNLCKIYRQY